MVRVASFNIRNGRAFDGTDSWPFRAPATATAIAGLAADVVGLQEAFAFQLRSLRRRLPHLEDVGRGRTNGRWGERCPILWERSGPRLVDHVTRWYGDTPDEPGTKLPDAPFPRIATMARFEVPALGTELRVTCTHLDSKSAERRAASLDQLLTWLDLSVPNVVLGDFNATPGNRVFARLTAAGLRHALPPDAGGTAHGFTGRTDGNRIDHIFVTSHLEVVAAEVTHPRPGGRLPSDHWPIVADLRLAGGAGTTG
jgi:endonuclease/exonuclease/phosphatase family metal-dependent hydrolase